MKVVGSCDSRQCRTVSNRLHWRAPDRCLGLLRRYLQIGKVALGSRSDPQGDSSFGCVEPRIVDDEAGLFGSVHVESRLAAFDFDVEFGLSRLRAASQRTTRTFREPLAVIVRSRNPDENYIVSSGCAGLDRRHARWWV